jgi:hypothetical protein
VTLIGGRQKARTELATAGTRHLEFEGNASQLKRAFVKPVGSIVLAASEELTPVDLIESLESGCQNLTQAEVAKAAPENLIKLSLSLLGQLGR